MNSMRRGQGGILLMFTAALLSMPCWCPGQRMIIQGQIRDTSGAAVDFANVFLKKDIDSTRVLAFTLSNSEGYYELEIDAAYPVSSFVLVVRKLSYEEKQLPLKGMESGKETLIRKNITLRKKTFEFQEVVIAGQTPPVITKKDTVVLDADAFRDGNEEVVEDLLAKLPGISVSETGNISVNGKPVEKILVESDDLFGKRYTILSKNLSAEVVDKVEVLERFTENPVLKGIHPSDKVALNLKLKEDRKSTLFGNVQAGYGTSGFYENRLNLMSFYKKTKFYALANVNNSGVETGSELRRDATEAPQLTGSPFHQYTLDGPLVALRLPQPDLKRERYNFNNAEFISLNGILRPAPKVKLKGLFMLDLDEWGLQEQSLFTYPAVEVSVQEDKQSRHTRKNYLFQLEATYDINRRSRLQYRGSRTRLREQFQRRVITNDLPLLENLHNNSINDKHRLTLTRKLTGNQAVDLTMAYHHETLPQDYRLNRILFDAADMGFHPNAAIQQPSLRRNSLAIANIRYLRNLQGNILEIAFGYARNLEQLSSTIQGVAPDKKPAEAGPAYRNDLDLSLNDLYAKVALRKKWRSRFSFHGALEGRIVQMQMFNEKATGDQNEEKQRRFFLLPRFQFKWEPDAHNQLSLSYGQGRRNLTLPDIAEGMVLDSYRDFTTGTGRFSQLNSSFLLLNYYHGGWSDRLLLNANVMLVRDHFYLSADYDIRPFSSRISNMLLRNRTMLSSGLALDQFVAPLTGNLKLKAGLANTAFQNSINTGPLRDVRSWNFTPGIEWRTVFNGMINFHTGIEWNITEVRQPTEAQNVNRLFFFDLTLTPLSRLSLQLKNDWYVFQSGSGSSRTFHFFDLDLRYVMIKNKFSLSLKGRNLFNNTSFSTIVLDDLQENISNFRLLPGFLLFKIDFRF